MNESLHLYLTGTQAMLRVRSGPPWGRAVADLAAWSWTPAAGLQPPCPLPGGRWRRVPLHVYAGAALCRLGVFDLPAGVRAAGEVEAVGRARLVHELELDAARWRFCCDHDRSRGKVIACAVRADAFVAVGSLAEERRLRLASVRPFAAVLANAVGLAGAASPLVPSGEPRTLLVVEADAFTVFGYESAALATAAALPHDGQPGALQRAVQRLAASGAAAAEGALAILAHRSATAHVHGVAHALLPASRYLKHTRYADFRDTMFHPEPASCD